MRKASLLFVLLAFALFSFGQGNTLWRVSWAKPKGDQVTAFETALKSHVQKFHPATKSMLVFEILSGDRSGYYQFVHGPGSWSQMDSMTPNPEHDADWEKNVAPKLSDESGNYVYRYADSVSFNNTAPVEKSRLQFINWKPGTKFQDVMGYYKKLKQVYEKNQDNRSYSVFIQQLSGNHSQFVIMHRYTSWSQLEFNYYKPLKEMYEKEFGQRAWDEWMKFIDDNVGEVTTLLRKLRPDLSTPAAK